MAGGEIPEVRSPPSLSATIPPPLSIPAAGESEKGEPLSPAARFFRQPQFNCHVITFLGFGKIVAAGELTAGLEATLIRHPRFSSIQVAQKSGDLRWVPTTVDLDRHIFYPELGPAGAAAAAGDHAAGDKFVEDYASSLCQSPLDPSRPLWDIHVLAIRTSDASAVAIFRTHHSLGDGMSLMSLFLACTRRTSDFQSLPTLPAARRRPPATSAGAGAGAGNCAVLLWICNFLVFAWNTFLNAFLFLASAFFLKDSKTPIMGSDGVEFRKKRFVHRTLLLDDIKGVKEAMGCTINDVLLGVTSAALTRYLSRRYDGRLPPNLRIRASLLVNIRPIPGINDLAEMMKKGSGAKWGNHLGYILLRLPVMKCVDPLDYVRKGKEVAEKKKRSWEAIFTYTSAFLIVKCFGIKKATNLCHRIVSSTTLSFSNVVGPTEEVGFCGSPLIYIAPSVYGHPQALTIHFQSYGRKMKVVVAVDELVIPDPHKFLDDIVQSLQLIKEEAVAKGK